jgi:hypothetical protein
VNYISWKKSHEVLILENTTQILKKSPLIFIPENGTTIWNESFTDTCWIRIYLTSRPKATSSRIILNNYEENENVSTPHPELQNLVLFHFWCNKLPTMFAMFKNNFFVCFIIPLPNCISLGGKNTRI